MSTKYPVPSTKEKGKDKGQSSGFHCSCAMQLYFYWVLGTGYRVLKT